MGVHEPACTRYGMGLLRGHKLTSARDSYSSDITHVLFRTHFLSMTSSLVERPAQACGIYTQACTVNDSPE